MHVQTIDVWEDAYASTTWSVSLCDALGSEIRSLGGANDPIEAWELALAHLEIDEYRHLTCRLLGATGQVLREQTHEEDDQRAAENERLRAALVRLSEQAQALAESAKEEAEHVSAYPGPDTPDVRKLTLFPGGVIRLHPSAVEHLGIRVGDTVVTSRDADGVVRMESMDKWLGER